MFRADAVAAAEAALAWAQYYLWFGLAFALVFLVFGVERVAPGARGSYLFRLVVLPGAAGLWPLVLWRWIVLSRRDRE